MPCYHASTCVVVVKELNLLLCLAPPSHVVWPLPGCCVCAQFTLLSTLLGPKIFRRIMCCLCCLIIIVCVVYGLPVIESSFKVRGGDCILPPPPRPPWPLGPHNYFTSPSCVMYPHAWASTHSHTLTHVYPECKRSPLVNTCCVPPTRSSWTSSTCPSP